MQNHYDKTRGSIDKKQNHAYLYSREQFGNCAKIMILIHFLELLTVQWIKDEKDFLRVIHSSVEKG